MRIWFLSYPSDAPLGPACSSRDKLIFFRRVIDPRHHQGILEVLSPLWRLVLQGFFGLNDLVVWDIRDGIDPLDGGGDPLYLADFSISSPLVPSSPRGVPRIGPSIDLHGGAIGDGSQAFR